LALGAKGPVVHAEAMSERSSVAWVVGFDGSPASKHAAAWALANAAGRADSIRLVQAFSVAAPPMYSPTESLRLAEVMESIEVSTRQELDRFAAEIASTTTTTAIDITTTLEQGSASGVLLDAVTPGDVLVVGARGAGGFERLVLGSTSTQCATHAVGPTVVVSKPSDEAQAARAHSIVVPIDGSDNSVSAFDWACAFAEPGSEISVISVWEFTPSLFSGESFYFPEAIADARRRFDELLAALVNRCQRDDIVIDGVFIQGSPREVIALRASDADLLVMGARGRGAVGATLLGSVSTWLLHHVRQPMVVVPQPMMVVPRDRVS
jgi:nucleotide-binding universal stress UspA family protein